MAKIRWLSEPQPHDYPAAASYLSLIADNATITAILAALQAAPTTTHKAKDILRSSRLKFLQADNPHVASDLKKVRDGQALSPILLVRGDIRSGALLQIADGYHRVCASYLTDEDTDIPCRLTELPA
jgi:hypothetical protein